MLKVAVVVPEYRTDVGGNGGVSAVADFIVEALSRTSGIEVSLVSPRMSSRAAESRRLLAPTSWFATPKGHVRRSNGHDVTYVGASLAEWEPVRYLPRRALDTALGQCDRVVVVAGSPAIAWSLRRVKAPVLLQVATWIHLERQAMLSQQRGWRRVGFGFNTSVTSWLDRKALDVVDGILVENLAMLQSLHQIAPGKVALVPPGVDTEYFSPAQDAEIRQITMVGRLADPRKDLETLVSGYARARELGVDLPLVMAGRGTPPASVSRLITTLGLQDCVTVESDVPMDRLRELHRASKVFCLSSHEEGLGIAILEAMACGVPVVATATEGAKMILGELASAGELVRIADPDAFGSALARAVARTNQAQGAASAAARKHVVDNYSFESSGQQFVEIIRNGTVGAYLGTH